MTLPLAGFTVGAPDDEPGVNYLCPGLKRFFAHAVPEAKRIAARLRAEPIGLVPRT